MDPFTTYITQLSICILLAKFFFSQFTYLAALVLEEKL